MQANSGDPDQTPHSLASDLGLHYLPMSNIKGARHIWVKMQLFAYLVRVAQIWEVDCRNNLPGESAQGTSDMSKYINMKTL